MVAAAISCTGRGIQPRGAAIADGVSVADISGVVKGHEYCTLHPCTYGSTVLYYNKESLAPFDPIPQGQAATATVLKQSFPERQAFFSSLTNSMET